LANESQRIIQSKEESAILLTEQLVLFLDHGDFPPQIDHIVLDFHLVTHANLLASSCLADGRSCSAHGRDDGPKTAAAKTTQLAKR
jgi:hypothetical protein